MRKFLVLIGFAALCACGVNNGDDAQYVATPTVDYVERLDIDSAPQKDSFLNQLAMNYRSYAIFNARQSGYPDIGEIFAQKSVAAFSGESPFPEAIDSWKIYDQNLGFELSRACQDLINMLKNDMSDYCPVEMAEAQAKFDCWLSASASGQTATASECRSRFHCVMDILRRGGPNGCGTTISKPKTAPVAAAAPAPEPEPEVSYYPETANMMPAQMRAREGLVIVNNVNVQGFPEHLIKPEPVQPMVFNQNIYGGDKKVENSGSGFDIADEVMEEVTEETEEITKETVFNKYGADGDNAVSRQEFIEMMLMMREEIRAINARLDNTAKSERAVLKVQQIPLEPKQHVMEEVFEIYFDFDKAKVKPEYEEIISKLVQATQGNRNMKISVVGHTDTVGSSDYNYALGGRRAESVRKMLIQYGIPGDQIVAVSSGKKDLKVQTKDQVRNAENRRVRVVKEQRYTEQPDPPYVNAVVEADGYETEVVQ
jgi:peptidoglycan-associated lipoprotein